MSSAEEVVRRSIEAWSAEDWDELESLHARDVVIVAPRGWPESGEFAGWEAVRRQWERMRDSWIEDRLELDGLESRGDSVLAHARWKGRGGASGLDFELEAWLVYTLRARRIARVEYYLDEGSARRCYEELTRGARPPGNPPGGGAAGR